MSFCLFLVYLHANLQYLVLLLARDPLQWEEHRWGRFTWCEGIVAREYIAGRGKPWGGGRVEKGEEVRVFGEIWAATYTTIVTYIYTPIKTTGLFRSLSTLPLLLP